MQATYEDLEVLTEVQRIDIEVLQTKKTRASLPQRIQVVKIRKKREEIVPKLQKVIELQRATESKMTAIEDEDKSLAQKQERAQEIIQAAGSDFRKAESHSKDMAGVTKRRTTLEESLSKLTEEMNRIVGVRAQLENAIVAFETEEKSLVESYQEKDNELINTARELLEQRKQMIAQIDTDLADMYEKTAQKTGGVALGQLEEGGVCSVCRSTISGGRLIELMSQVPVGVCPSCRRLLIIH